MKFVFNFSLFAVFVALAGAAPAPQTVDWRAVQSNVNAIRQLVRIATTSIVTVANDDNPVVGERISLLLHDAAFKVLAVLDHVSYEINSQSLNVEQAELHFADIKNVIAAAQHDLQNDLVELSVGAAGQICDTFTAAYSQAERKAQEVLDLLRQSVHLKFEENYYWQALE